MVFPPKVTGQAFSFVFWFVSAVAGSCQKWSIPCQKASRITACSDDSGEILDLAIVYAAMWISLFVLPMLVWTVNYHNRSSEYHNLCFFLTILSFFSLVVEIYIYIYSHKHARTHDPRMEPKDFKTLKACTVSAGQTGLSMLVSRTWKVEGSSYAAIWTFFLNDPLTIWVYMLSR